ncbi:MAG: DUF2029 domain-containing protein [Rhodobacter sp.]|nr:DUF2029 domain-containing protein [Rhodobacter sp.]
MTSAPDSLARTPGFRPDPRTLFAATAMAAFAYIALFLLWNTFPADLSALYMAGHLFQTGQYNLIYAAPDGFFGASPPEWQPLLPALGLAGQDVLPYVYPPLWAAVMAPLSALGPQGFFQAAALVELALLMASVWLAWRLCRSFAIPFWAWALTGTVLLGTSVISFTALMHLQPQIVVVFLTLLAFERYSTGQSRLAGTLLGLAAMLKLAPAGLVLIFLLDRNWRALGGFAVTCAVLGGLGLALTGVGLHLEFLSSMAAAGDGLFITSITYSADLLLHGLAAALDLVPPLDADARNFRVPDAGLAVAIAGKALLVAALIWTVAGTARLPDSHRLPARLLAFSLLINLFGPLGWVHYYLPQLLLLPALIGLLPRFGGAVLLALVGTLTSWPLLMLLRTEIHGDFAIAAMGTATMALLFIAVVRLARA